MSDPFLKMQRQAQALQDQLERLRKADVPAIFLPYAQRAVNPIAATSASGDFAIMRAAVVRFFFASAFVTGTNDGSNYWTIDLRTTAAATIATVNTSAFSPNTWGRLAASPTGQPGSTDAELVVVVTTTGGPGTLYVVPSVSVTM